MKRESILVVILPKQNLFLKKNKKYAIFIGSLRWYKGLDLILKVFEKNTQWKLVIVGEGILKSHLQQHIKEKKTFKCFSYGILKRF